MSKKTYSARFKFQVVLEAIQSPERMGAEIARAYEVHPVTLSSWKKHFLEEGAKVFGSEGALSFSAPPSRRQHLNSESPEKSKPASSRSRLRAYF